MSVNAFMHIHHHIGQLITIIMGFGDTAVHPHRRSEFYYVISDTINVLMLITLTYKNLSIKCNISKCVFLKVLLCLKRNKSTRNSFKLSSVTTRNEGHFSVFFFHLYPYLVNFSLHSLFDLFYTATSHWCVSKNWLKCTQSTHSGFLVTPPPLPSTNWLLFPDLMLKAIVGQL